MKMLILVIEMEELKLDSVKAKMETVSHAEGWEEFTSSWKCFNDGG